MISQQTESKRQVEDKPEPQIESPKEFDMDKGIDIERGKTEWIEILEGAKRDLGSNGDIRGALEKIIHDIQTEKLETDSTLSRSETLVTRIGVNFYELKNGYNPSLLGVRLNLSAEEQERLNKSWKDFKNIARAIFFIHIDDAIDRTYDMNKHLAIGGSYTGETVERIIKPGFSILNNHPTSAVRGGRWLAHITRKE
jgi:hypothetical protein